MSHRVRVVPAALLAGAGIAFIGAFGYFTRGIAAEELQFWIVFGSIPILSVFALYLYPLYSPMFVKWRHLFVDWGRHALGIIPFLRSPRLTFAGITLAALFVVLGYRSEGTMDSMTISIAPTQYVGLGSSFGYIRIGIYGDSDRAGNDKFEFSTEDTAQLRMRYDWMISVFNRQGIKRTFDPYRSLGYTNLTTITASGRKLSSIELRFPHWLVAAIAMAFVTLAYARATRKYVRVRRNHCRTCEYDLTGNTSGICPECGTEVSESTYR